MQNPWDDIAARYDNLYTSAWSVHENTAVGNWLNDLTLGGSILDVGCGTGFLGRELAGRGHKLIGIDASTRMLDVAESTGTYDDLIQIDLNSGNLDSLNHFGPFNTILSTWGALNYTRAPITVFKRVERFAANQATVGIMTFNRWSLRRIFRLKFSEKEGYGTRGHDVTLGAITLPKNKQWEAAFLESGYQSVEISTLGALSGVLERPALWRIDDGITKWINIGHMALIAGKRE